ncbi:HTH_Tnp_Tc3_2 domain-containing protein [Trichonephila clavipes]|nr:HTH_Tnp_Tc3_2 domain-containing protein [Trichonephila clavipes]
MGVPSLRLFLKWWTREFLQKLQYGPRAAAVTEIRLLTGHDRLCAHLYRFNLTDSPFCVLCASGQVMDASRLDEGRTDRCGRSHTPQFTTSRENRQIVCMAGTDHPVTSRTVAQHIESVTHHSVSASTIRHRLQQSGLSARRPLLNLPLSQNHRHLQYQWCDITPPASTPDQFWQRVEAAWSAVPQEHIQSLFEAVVISSNGGDSGY